MKEIDWNCVDCGVNTLNDYYMVKNPVWRSAGLERAGMEDSGMIHRPCLEKRLGRQLTLNDFPPYPVNSKIYEQYGALELFIKELERLEEIGFEAYEEEVEREFANVLYL